MFIVVVGFLGVSMIFPDQDNVVFIPVIYTDKSSVGIESEASAVMTRSVWNPVTPIKISCLWSEIEPLPMVYDWSECDRKVGDLPITWIDIRHTPKWALSMPKSQPQCHLPQTDSYLNLRIVIERMVQRYPSVKFIGIWNEPEIPDTIDPYLYQFIGCLGPDGGQDYGEMVRWLYDHADIGDAQIVIGNLADFDSRFSRDMLSAADGHYDAASFHCYAHDYDGELVNSCVDEYYEARSILDEFEHDKLLHLSETAVIRYTGDVGSFEASQLQHFADIKDLPGYTFWYTGYYNAWPAVPFNSDMWTKIYVNFEWQYVPRPVWYEYMSILREIPQ